MSGAALRDAHQIAQSVRTGQRSASDVVRHALDALRAIQPTLNACVDILDQSAMAHAARLDAQLAGRAAEGPRAALPLLGVPVVVKDNICTGPDLDSPGDGLGPGGRTTCCSRMLANYRSPYSATVVQRLVGAGAVIVAKGAMDEFAMGSSGETSCFGPARHPQDPSRVPGGSSSGSAVAVAAGCVPLALGSDTGGSIRQPAGFCGLVGVKPTYGRISRYGLVAFASSLDQIGPLTASVRDAALALEVLCGHDPLDATSVDRPDTEFLRDLHSPIAGLTLGVPRQARSDANHPGVRAAFEATLERFRTLGARIIDVEIPTLDAAIAAYYIVAPAEASSNLARFDGVRYGHRARLAPGDGLMELYCKSRSEGLGPEVQRRIMLGTHVLSSGYADAYYTTALKVRRALLNDFETAFRGQGCHALLTPTSPNPAWTLGEKSADPLAMYLEDVYTVGVNLAGLPAMSVPMGSVNVDEHALPIGLQIIAHGFEESSMLRVAHLLEASARAAP